MTGAAAGFFDHYLINPLLLVEWKTGLMCLLGFYGALRRLVIDVGEWQVSP